MTLRDLCPVCVPSERPLSLSLSLFPRQVSGLLRRRFHRTAPAALQVTGLDASRAGEAPRPGAEAGAACHPREAQGNQMSDLRELDLTLFPSLSPLKFFIVVKYT